MAHTQRNSLMGMSCVGERARLVSRSGWSFLLSSLQPSFRPSGEAPESWCQSGLFLFPPQLKALRVKGALFQPHWNLQIGLNHSKNGTENSVSYKSPGPPPIGTTGWNDKKVPIHQVGHKVIHKICISPGSLFSQKGSKWPLMSIECEAVLTLSFSCTQFGIILTTL